MNCQSPLKPPQAKLASKLVVRCVPHLAQTLQVTGDINSSNPTKTFAVNHPNYGYNKQFY